MAVRAHRHLASGLFAFGLGYRGDLGMQHDRRALFTGSAVAIGAWVVFLAVLWGSAAPR